MIALRTPRTLTQLVAALLIVLQGLATGLVTLAHASEQISATPALVAPGNSQGVASHDELRCPLCHYAGARAHPVDEPAIVAVANVERISVRIEAIAPSTPWFHYSAPPRAPPASLS